MITLVVEFDSTDPLRGRIRTPDTTTDFEGWLSLLAVLEALTGDTDAPRPADTDRE